MDLYRNTIKNITWTCAFWNVFSG